LRTCASSGAHRLSNAQSEATNLVQQTDLPDPVKQGIIQGIDNAVSSSSAEAAQSGEQQKFDLYDSVMQMAGQQVADANRATLDQLSQELQVVFAQAAASSLDRSFLVGVHHLDRRRIACSCRPSARQLREARSPASDVIGLAPKPFDLGAG
jgi:hypothetical protein